MKTGSVWVIRALGVERKASAERTQVFRVFLAFLDVT